MSMYLHTPALEVGSWWRVDTASGSDTATTVYAHDGADAIPTGLGASGSTVRNTRVDGTTLFWSSAATLYCKELTYQGVPNGTVVTSTGATPTTPGGAGTGGPVLGGPNVWTGTQDFTGATVTGAGGGGAAALLDRGNWATSTVYAVGDVTTQAGQRYACRTAHTAGTFATDLAASKWVSLDAVAAAASARVVTAGTGLTGGGDLTADRTLTVAYGTTSGTAAQGNDARITGALQAANNLSDVTAASARTNLGLGTAATISSTAAGDLSGTLPSPTVAKVNGVAISGTPSTGYVPTATSSTTATWQAGGGAGLPGTFVTKTTTYTAAAGEFVLADATSAGFTVTLPAGPTTGQLVGAKKTDSSANVVTVAAAGKTIDGDANATLVTRNAGGIFEYDGTNWRISAVGTATGSAGPTGPTGPTGGSGIQPLMAAGVLNSWYLASGVTSSGISNQSITAGTLVLGTPFIAPTAMTINGLGCYVSTGGTTGALVRLGLFQPSNSNPYSLALSSGYATLLVDGGTAAAETSATRVTITLGTPQVVAAGTPFCVGVAVQVTTVTIGCEANGQTAHGPWGSSSDSIWNGANLAVKATGVTGSLPSTFTPSAFMNSGVGGAGWFRRSA